VCEKKRKLLHSIEHPICDKIEKSEERREKQEDVFLEKDHTKDPRKVRFEGVLVGQIISCKLYRWTEPNPDGGEGGKDCGKSVHQCFILGKKERGKKGE